MNLGPALPSHVKTRLCCQRLLFPFILDGRQCGTNHVSRRRFRVACIPGTIKISSQKPICEDSWVRALRYSTESDVK